MTLKSYLVYNELSSFFCIEKGKVNMEYQDPIAIANYLIALSIEENKPLTNYKLQKMLFLVNQLSKKNTGQLLFNENL